MCDRQRVLMKKFDKDLKQNKVNVTICFGATVKITVNFYVVVRGVQISNFLLT